MRIVNSPNAAATQAVTKSRTIAESVIVGDVSDVTTTADLRCNSSQAPVPATVDDLFVEVRFVAGDGPGGVLGSAGPCWLRGGTAIPISGQIELDTADVAQLQSTGTLDETILHELGHVLGIGTIWGNKNLLTGSGGADPRFVGTNAVNEWHNLGGTGTLPVENNGASGTRDSHWRESVFANELMTGYLNSGSNPLSRMTAASLKDLGYQVNLGAADAYNLPGSLSRPATAGKTLDTGKEQVHGPIGTI